MTERWVLRAKIHKAKVTDANLDYVGSITMDENLLELAGIWAGEKVLVVSNTTGERLETYTIARERGSGDICMNGAAAHRIDVGEEIIIMGFSLGDRPITPTLILVDKSNEFVRYL
ncbi:MAG: aspartate 1-decarboxylase [Anaerolineales bacterium]|nr:aspartate 1-decarboxylase [Anaerolineales bacterium]